MRISYSTLSLWNSCPLKGHFKETLEVEDRVNAKAVFGTIIHMCLEDLNKGVSIENCIERFKDLWDNPDKIGSIIDFWPRNTTYGGLRDKGVEILNLYYDKVKWENRQILATEHKFLVPFGDHELKGVVDLLEVKKAGNGHRTLRICDYKTAGRQPTKIELFLNQQFTVYYYASLQPEFWMGNGPDYPGIPGGEDYFEAFKRINRKAIWVHLMNMKDIDAGPRDDDDFYRLYRLVTEIEKAQDAGVFVPNIGESCVWCPYTDPCGVPIPKELAEEALVTAEV